MTTKAFKMNLNSISQFTVVHLIAILFSPPIINTFDTDDTHEYDLYDSIGEDEIQHPSTTATVNVYDSSKKNVTNNIQKTAIVTTQSPFKLMDKNVTSFNLTTIPPSKHPITPKVDSNYFTPGNHYKATTIKRSLQQNLPNYYDTYDPNGLICMRTSRANCQQGDQQQQQPTNGGFGQNEKPSSVWHCLSTQDSPSCICTCDGSCDPVIAINRQQQQSRQAYTPPPSGPTVNSRICDDCSCLYASIGPGSCLCTPGCG